MIGFKVVQEVLPCTFSFSFSIRFDFTVLLLSENLFNYTILNIACTSYVVGAAEEMPPVHGDHCLCQGSASSRG